MSPPKDLIDIFAEKERFLILSHLTPDGDAFGSSVALKFLLEQFNKKADIYSELPLPAQYRFLPGAEYIKNINSLSVEDFDVLVLVDCNNPSRVSYNGGIVEKVKKFSGSKVIIDHHIEDNDSIDFRCIKWIDPEKAATAVMIYYLFRTMGGKITPEIATNLYTAIIVDTGNFQFDNTTDEVLFIASELVRAGANPSYIYQQCFESWSTERFKLFVKMLNSVEIISSLAVACINKDDFDETSTAEHDTERFVEFLRILKNVNISALFREIEKNSFKVSLRSKGDFDVSVVARQFGGGGHKNAAGYRITASFEEARRRLFEKLKDTGML